jgi:UDP-N-acetylmuramate--alanine ligase
VAEADESDGSFLSFSPHAAIVTNLEPDHLDHHGTAEAYTAVFDQFVDRIEPGGFLVVCADDPGTAALAGRADLRRVITYGRDESAMVRLLDGLPAVDAASGDVRVPAVRLADGQWVGLSLSVPGDHMMLNAVAALAAGVQLGVDPQALADGLAAYTGVRRRFELKGEVAGVTVYDDYAHHPTEVSAQIAAARGVLESSAVSSAGGRLVVVFQPHLYSRTASFADAFGAALAGADVVVVLDVYGAREDPQLGVTGELIATAVPPGSAIVHYHPDRSSAATFVTGVLTPGDIVITMGAGDVTTIGPELLTLLAAG